VPYILLSQKTIWSKERCCTVSLTEKVVTIEWRNIIDEYQKSGIRWNILEQSILTDIGSEVLTTVIMQSSISYISSCNPWKVNRSFGGKCRLHLQGWRVSQSKKPVWSRKQVDQLFCLSASCRFLAWLTLQSWRWRLRLLHASCLFIAWIILKT
jgi:hypothetical protein